MQRGGGRRWGRQFTGVVVGSGGDHSQAGWSAVGATMHRGGGRQGGRRVTGGVEGSGGAQAPAAGRERGVEMTKRAKVQVSET